MKTISAYTESTDKNIWAFKKTISWHFPFKPIILTISFQEREKENRKNVQWKGWY